MGDNKKVLLGVAFGAVITGFMGFIYAAINSGKPKAKEEEDDYEWDPPENVKKILEERNGEEAPSKQHL